MNTMIKLRAFYKPDLKNGDILPFHLVEMDDDLRFAMEADNDFSYDFAVPFLDDDWIIHRWTGFNDAVGVDIYEGDCVRFEWNTAIGQYGGLIMWNDKHKLLGIKPFSPEINIYPLFNFLRNDGTLMVWNDGVAAATLKV